MLQQKLSNLQILKSQPNSSSFYTSHSQHEDSKRSPMIQVKKLKYNKLGGEIIQINPVLNHTIQDRYLVNAKSHNNADMTQSNDYYKKARMITPEQNKNLSTKNNDYFYIKEDIKKIQSDSEPPCVQIMGKKLPPLQSVQVDRIKLNQKQILQPQTQTIFRPQPQQSLYPREPPLMQQQRNKHQSNSNINQVLQKEIKDVAQEKLSDQELGLQRSISTPFMNKKNSQKLVTSRSNSPVNDVAQIQQEKIKQITSDQKSDKQRKNHLAPIPAKKSSLHSQLVSPNQSGSNTKRHNFNNMDSDYNSNANTTKEEFKKKQALKKKLIKPKVLQAINPQEDKITQRHSSHRNFINKINFSNNICITSPKNQHAPSYIIYVGKGNNSSLIKSAFKLRWWWTEVETADAPSINMSWTQLRQNNFLELLQSYQEYDDDINVSSFLDHSLQDVAGDNEGENSDSDFENRSKSVRLKLSKNQVKQLQNRSFQQRQNQLGQTLQQIQMAQFKPPNYLALKKILNSKDLTALLQFMEKSNFKETIQVFSDCTEQLLLQMKQIVTTQRLNSRDFKMHNHLENNWNLSNKKALFYNMRAYYENIDQDYSKYLPLTFHIKQGIKDKEYERLVEYYNNRNEEMREMSEKLKAIGQTSLLDRKNVAQKQKDKVVRNIWIIKPGENTNRGTGISVCADLNEITQMISSGEVHPNGKLKTYIVQQYIDNPFLYNKRKFDMRCYMLMTSQNGILKGYWYQDGYIRTTSKEYSLKSFNKMIHLTNDAVQKKGEEYGKFESGNKISFLDFQRYLDQNHPDQKLSFYNDIYPKMKSLALDTIKSVYGKIDPKKRNNSFELFGLDFMIDDAFKLWLIEVNTNPCLELSCPLLSRIIPSLVENVLRIAVDPVFPPPFIDEWPVNKKQFSPDNVLENNKFELVFDELVDYQYMRHLLTTMKTNQHIFDIEEMEEEEDDE